LKTVFEYLESSHWQQLISESTEPAVITDLTQFLNQELTRGKVIYPQPNHWFRALNELPVQDIKVVILGQDPYHGPKQAQGLSFSVPEGHKCPPSLRNIFKELDDDIGIKNESPDLTKWLSQGVLLLNAVLTVEQSKAGSHAKKGWESITDAVIRAISEQQSNVVFMLWGAYAEKKKSLIDETKHCILTSVHPSPLSAHRGWFGCKHFSKANRYLTGKNRQAVDWRTTDNPQSSLF
jgi:uracil-DNA glycosylase